MSPQANDVADRDVLAEQVARGLDAVRGHVEQRAAAGQLGVPEVGGVRAAVALARAERHGRPIDPASIISRIRIISALKTTFSR